MPFRVFFRPLASLALVLALALATPLTVAGCGDDDGAVVTDAGPSSVDASPDGGGPPPMACRTGTGWDPSRPAFENRATEWGLGAVRGNTLATADIDGDGFADLFALDAAGNARTELDAVPPVIHVRVLMNRPRAGGGREFVDATRDSNFLETRSGDAYGRALELVTFGDVDNDGDVDAFSGFTYDPAGADPGDRSELMLNDGRGVFTLGPELLEDPLQPNSSGSVFIDYDLDGAVDLASGYWFRYPNFTSPFGQQNQLFEGAGDGSFVEVTAAAGLTLGDTMASLVAGTNKRPLFGTTACDVSGDGRPDLIGATYGRAFNLLMVSDGDAFVDQSLASGVAADENLDYSDDESYLCFCLANPTMCPSGLPRPRYACPGRGWQPGVTDQPYRLAGNTFSIACGDVDNDGDMDLYTAEIAHPDVGSASDKSELLINDTTSPDTVHFTRPGRAAMGLTPPVGTNDEGGLSNALFDFDNDGRLDVYLGGSDYDEQYGWLFHQNADGTFTLLPDDAGFHHPCAHGLALADFDRDGDVDVIVGTSLARTWCTTQWMGTGAAVRMYENVSNEMNWTSIRLVGRGAGGANALGIGARIRVTAGGVTQTRELQGSWGHYDLGHELVANFGLGTACTIDRIEVRWPNATLATDVYTDVRANYPLELTEGSTAVRYLAE